MEALVSIRYRGLLLGLPPIFLLKLLVCSKKVKVNSGAVMLEDLSTVPASFQHPRPLAVPSQGGGPMLGCRRGSGQSRIRAWGKAGASLRARVSR